MDDYRHTVEREGKKRKCDISLHTPPQKVIT